jgi:hypothetical protein
MVATACAVAFCGFAVARSASAQLVVDSGPQTVIELAQAHGTEPGELEPRYKPVPPEEKSWYNSGYIFGMTRGVAASTVTPAMKGPLFLLTIPLDIVLLPFAAIGGMFG